MASISRQPNGRRTIQFTDGDRVRRSIRLGKCSQKQAVLVKTRIEIILAGKTSGHPLDVETARWVSELDDVLADRLAKTGLIPKRKDAEKDAGTLEAFLERYLQVRTDLKPRTRMKLETTRRMLIEYFGADKALCDISPGDADEWRIDLVNRGLGENTVRKHAQIAKQFCNAAVRRRLLPANPFADLKATCRPNAERFYFVTTDEAATVIEHCPDAEWRLLFALARWGGLRCPSEHLALRWGDVDWERNRITVHSPKTEHHDGKASRIVPLFPELRPYLEECFDLAEEGTEFVISRYRDSNVNLRTRLLRIIRRAGLEAWPKLFQNLRSTRQTELEERFPSHVVCAWMGNSQPVAKRHYLQVTEEHFERAAKSGADALHFPVQPASASSRHDSPSPADDEPAEDVRLELAMAGDYWPNVKVAEEGLEPPTRGL